MGSTTWRGRARLEDDPCGDAAFVGSAVVDGGQARTASTISGASSVSRSARLTYVAFTPFARASSSRVPCTPVYSIVCHRNARASALTMALSTRGRGADGPPLEAACGAKRS